MYLVHAILVLCSLMLFVLLFGILYLSKGFRKKTKALNSEFKINSTEYGFIAKIGIDKNNRIIGFNRAFSKMFNIKEAEYIGKSIFTTPIEPSVINRLIDLSDESITNNKIIYNCPQTNNILYCSSYKWVNRENGIMYITFAFEDLTAILSERNNIDRIIEMYAFGEKELDQCFWIWDLDTNKVYTTPNCKPLWGMSDIKEDVYPDLFISRIYHEDAPDMKILENNIEKNQNYTQKIRMTSSNGKLIPIENQVFIITTDKGTKQLIGISKKLKDAEFTKLPSNN